MFNLSIIVINYFCNKIEKHFLHAKAWTDDL